MNLLHQSVSQIGRRRTGPGFEENPVEDVNIGISNGRWDLARGSEVENRHNHSMGKVRTGACILAIPQHTPLYV